MLLGPPDVFASGDARFGRKVNTLSPSDAATSSRTQEKLDALRRECEALRQERDELRAKLQLIAQVIGANDTAKIIHDVRNVMNELVLLRELSSFED